jgi:hypothetical protein
MSVSTPAAGQGRTPLAVVSGNALESKAQLAYRAYIEHRPACVDCQEGDAFHCPAASRLWDAYKEARA